MNAVPTVHSLPLFFQMLCPALSSLIDLIITPTQLTQISVFPIQTVYAFIQAGGYPTAMLDSIYLSRSYLLLHCDLSSCFVSAVGIISYWFSQAVEPF